MACCSHLWKRSPANADLAALVTRLLAEVDQLRAEVTGLRRENLELRQQAGYWQSRHADAVRRIAALEQENEQLRGENPQAASRTLWTPLREAIRQRPLQ